MATVFLKALYGPFASGNEIWHGGFLALRWCFIGINEDNFVAHYQLFFTGATRTYSMANSQITRKDDAITEPTLFVPDKPMLYGKTITEILRKQLPDKEISRAVEFAMKRRGKK